MSKVGKKLKRLLFERGMTPTDLSREIDISQQTLQRITTGEIKKPRKDKVKKIADFFEIPPSELLKGDIFSEEGITPKAIPVYEWKDLKELFAGKNVDPKQHIVVGSAYSEKTFGVFMEDASMVPFFDKGNILIIDPMLTAKERDYILTYLHKTERYDLAPVYRTPS